MIHLKVWPKVSRDCPHQNVFLMSSSNEYINKTDDGLNSYPGGICNDSKRDSASVKKDNYFPGTGFSDKNSFFESSVRKDFLVKGETKYFSAVRTQENRMQAGNNDLIIEKYKAKQAGDLGLRLNFSKPDYIRAILKTKEHIP